MRSESIDWAAHIEAVARRLCGEPNKALSNREELRFGTNGSLRVSIGGLTKGTWRDHENNISGGVLALIQHKLGLSNGAAIDWFKSELHVDMADKKPATEAKPASPQRVVETYRYHDEQGSVLYRVLRWGPHKTFVQNPPDGKGGWITGPGCMAGIRRVPYWLNEWVWHPDRALLIAEGEKDVDRLRSLGLLATCNVAGAGNWMPHDKSKSEEGRKVDAAAFTALFRGRTVIVLPDNDDAGRSHADDIVRSLLPVVAEIKVVELPGLAPKGDVSDWLNSGGDREGLLALIEAAVPVREIPAPRPAKVIQFRQNQSRDQPEGDAAETPASYVQNDIGNALMLVEQHGRNLRYVLGPGWHAWDGKRYAHDAESVQTQKLAHEISGNLIEIAREEHDKDLRLKKLKWAISSGNTSRINGMLTQAKSYLHVTSNDLDSDPLLLNCRNGTVDLRTGDLLQHNHDHLITKICGTDYDPRATCPRWERFMLEIFGNDTEMVSFVQRAIGYSLTGLTSEQVVFILHGAGSNGKSVLLETIKSVLAEYVERSAADTWSEKQKNSPTNDIAKLAGARFVSVVETEKDQHIAESLVKQATGGDEMTVRMMYKEFFTFKPKFKLWFATNHKPKIKGSDFAIWRRIILIPFLVTFNSKDKLTGGQKLIDPDLETTLAEERAGILAWMVRGCLAWQDGGLKPPSIVTNATEDYQDSQDNVSAFIRDNCRLDKGIECAGGLLYASYELWCEENDESPISGKAFALNLEDRGMPSGPRTNKARIRKGVDLTQKSRDAAQTFLDNKATARAAEKAQNQ